VDIPVIDISGFASDDPVARARVVEAWRDAFDTLGFVTISGHGVPEDLVDAVYAAGLQFFEQPEARKRLWEFDNSHRGTKGTGYVRLFAQAVGKTRDGAGLPDVAESLSFMSPAIGRQAAAGEAFDNNIWPDTPVGFRELIGRYTDHASALGRRIMRISALALGLPETYFEPYYAPMTYRLRLAYYPEQAVAPPPGQLRNAAHTDFGCITILRQDDAPGGLQVLGPDGRWIDVRPTPGTFVINSGDLMQRWTNDRWKSNLHRVVNPPPGLGGSSRRLSVVFFTSPRLDSEIRCLPTCVGADAPLRYEPFVAADHMNLRLAQTYGGTD